MVEERAGSPGSFPGTEAGVDPWGRFAWGTRTYVMGIVNATPDSFSGDGCGGDVEAAVARGLAHVAAGASILDVGGESTRPGAAPVSAEVEAARVLPVIRALRQRTDAAISVDTYKPEVAAAALEAGACIVNDVRGVQGDGAMAAVAARHGAALIVMHSRPAAARIDALGGHYPDAAYADVVREVAASLLAAAGRAVQAGLPPERVWLDPGLGFGKTPAQSLELLRRLPELRLGHPLVVGPSRKSFIGRVLGEPAARRDLGTAAAVALGVAGGADVVRVHAVGWMADVAKVADAVVRGWQGC